MIWYHLPICYLLMCLQLIHQVLYFRNDKGVCCHQRSVVLNQWLLGPPGTFDNNWGHHFWLSHLRSGGDRRAWSWHLQERGQGTNKHPAMARKAPTTKNYQAQMLIVLSLRNPVKGSWTCRSFTGKKVWRKVRDILLLSSFEINFYAAINLLLLQ